MTTMYQVNATHPTAGTGSSMDSRTVGPFESRKIAEDGCRAARGRSSALCEYPH